MILSRVAQLSPQERFLYFVQERESIRTKRAIGLAKPWTDDEILQQYRFCNVRRMDDTVSQWLLKNWYTPYKNHMHIVPACALARHFNLPEALALITRFIFDPFWDEKSIKYTLRQRKAQGHNIFNGAYMVRGIGEVDKTEMVVSKVVQPLVDNPPKITGLSMQQAVEALLPYWGFSLFMAGQVVADLRWALRGQWKDRRIWAPMGPGSKRGMNRYRDRKVTAPLSQGQFLQELRELIADNAPKLPTSLAQRLEAMDWQNCLCEFDKYTRCLTGEGRPKQKYSGT